MKHLIVIIGLTFFIGCAFNQPLTLNHSKTVGKSIHEAASDGDDVNMLLMTKNGLPHMLILS